MILNKLKYLLLALIFCLAVVGSACADEAKDLVEWGSKCISSDPPGGYSLDYMDPGNPNVAIDIGSMECRINGKDCLECIITNGYPGYQASVDTEIVNITREPVKITGVKVTGKPDCILASLTDINGNDLTGKVIDKNSRVYVRVINRVRQTAAQAALYQFSVEIMVQQEAASSGGGSGGSGGSGNYPGNNPGDPGESGSFHRDREEPIELPGEKLVRTPREPEEPAQFPQEAVQMPVDLPVELPYTGGNIWFFAGTGLALGGLGQFLRHRK